MISLKGGKQEPTGGWVQDGLWVLPMNNANSTSSLLRRSILQCLVNPTGVDFFIDNVREAGVIIHGNIFHKVVLEFSEECFNSSVPEEMLVYKNAQTLFKQLYKTGSNANMSASYHVQEIKYSDGSVLHYLIVNLKRQHDDGSLRKRGRAFWSKLVADSIGQAASAAKTVIIAAPIIDFNHYNQELKDQVRLHNTTTRHMVRQPAVTTEVARTGKVGSFDHVTMIIKPQDK